MLDDPAVNKDLRRLRRYVLWSILPLPLLLAAVSIGGLLTDYGPTAVGLSIVACAVVVCWAAFVLTYWAVDRGKGLDRREWIIFGIGLAGLLPGILIEQLAPRPEGVDGSGWPTLAAVLVATLLANVADGRLWRVALLTTAAAVPVTVLACVFVHRTWFTFPPLILLFTFVLWSVWWIYGLARRLDRARRVSAELAVAEERLRFASELHDIQGHHLQVIALKSELAARLGEADPARAVAEMREVERLARQALTDTRSVVRGYRDVRLRTELANAVRVLNAAGIDARHGWDDERIELSDPDAERLLGLAVREATTNMIRHASPQRARLDLDPDGGDGQVRLTVRNDGAADGTVGGPAGGAVRGPAGGATGGSSEGSSGAVGDDGSAEVPAGSTSGGLSALRTRFVEAGGELDWHRQGDEFIVTAHVTLTPRSTGSATTGTSAGTTDTTNATTATDTTGTREATT